MKFYDLIEMLQEKDKGYIVLINAGGFYIAVGKDAVVLNKILDLKLCCMCKNVCKVGFPKASLEKYEKLIKRSKYSYIVYNYDREKNKLEILNKNKGKLESTSKDKDLIWLTKEIIYSNEGKKNLPIENYTSQIFANIYMNEVDQYIKHQLKIKYYSRYLSMIV